MLRFSQTVKAGKLCRYGSWGVCFTYATWFGIKGLLAAGKTYETSVCIRKACGFLLSKQLPCGGWGESYLSCQNKVYTNLPGNRSHIVNTSWALLALIEAGQVRDSALFGLEIEMQVGLLMNLTHDLICLG